MTTASVRWREIRARFLLREVSERAGDLPLASVTKDGGVEFRDSLSISVWNPGAGTDLYKRVRPGDFVIGLRSFQSGLGMSEIEAAVSPAYTVLRPVSHDLFGPFFRHFFKSEIFVSQLENVAQGIRQGRTISTEDFYNLPLPVPSTAEQRAIAGFLDSETARIDALIAKKRRLVELYGNRLTALAQMLTRRTSRRVPLRRIADAIRTGGTPANAAAYGPREAFENCTEWLSPADFNGGLTLASASRGVSPESCMETFRAGSVVIVGIGATAGKVAFLERPAWGNQQVTAIEIGDPAIARHVAWELWSDRSRLLAQAPFTTLPILNNDFLKAVEVGLPSSASCARTLDILGREAERAATLDQKLARQISLLEERRQGLIVAAVTGQMEIA
jgi:type I restriction enzyme S subunit